jgi:hypothetical protein
MTIREFLWFARALFAKASAEPVLPRRLSSNRRGVTIVETQGSNAKRPDKPAFC